MIDDLPRWQMTGGRRRDNRLAARGADIRSLDRRATLLVTCHSGSPETFKPAVNMERVVERCHQLLRLIGGSTASLSVTGADSHER